jgi:hypothetical protein
VNGVSYQIPIGTFTWQAGPTFTTNFAYDGNSNLILEVQHTGSNGGGYTGTAAQRGYAEWLENNAGGSTRTVHTVAQNAPYGPGPRTANFAYEARFRYLIDQSEARSLWYDSGLSNPQYLEVVLFPSLSSQPSGTQTTLMFQGAPELPLSGGQPDVAKASDWEDKLQNVSNYRFVRFEASFKGNGQTKAVPTIDDLVIPYIFFSLN